MRDVIHTEEREGFTITTLRLEEDTDPKGNASAIDEETDEAILEDIRSGKLDWFAVEVEASRHGVALGSAFLGGCCYASPSDFVTPGEGYYEDMVMEAIEEAKAMVSKLTTEEA